MVLDAGLMEQGELVNQAIVMQGLGSLLKDLGGIFVHVIVMEMMDLKSVMITNEEYCRNPSI